MVLAAAQAKVVVTHGFPGRVFTVGLWRPVTVLSRMLLDQLDDGELEATLAHELAHVAVGDHWRKWLAVLSRDVLAFTGLSFVAFRQLRSHMEVAADALAARLSGRPLALASSLIKSWRLGSSRSHQAWVLEGFAVGLTQGDLTLRVERLVAGDEGAASGAASSPGGTQRGRWAHPSIVAIWLLIGLASLVLC